MSSAAQPGSRGVNVARALWMLTAFSAIALWGAGLVPRYQELLASCLELTCPALSLSIDEISLMQATGFSAALYAGFQITFEVLSAVMFVIPGLLIYLRRSTDIVSLLFSFTLILAGTGGLVNADDAALRANPELLLTLSIFSSLVLFLFPDGKFVPAWTRTFLILVTLGSGAAALLAGGFQNLFNTPGFQQVIANAVFILVFAVGVYSKFYRFRWVSSPTERQQTKWVVFGIAAMTAGMSTWIILIEILALGSGISRIYVNLFVVAVVTILNWVFPLTVMLAIFRFRLWDIDIIIRRTLQNAVLTALLALAYFAGALILQSIIGLFGAQRSALVTVISTLAIAAIFNSLRRRVQSIIDQRFFRAKYTPSRPLPVLLPLLEMKWIWTGWLNHCWAWPKTPCSQSSSV